MDDDKRNCRKCRRTLPIAEFGSRQRFTSCADCRGRDAVRTREQRWRRHEQAIEVDVASGIKTCSQCRFTMPLERFHLDARRPDGRFPYCRQCRAERTGKTFPDRARYQSEFEFLTVLRAHGSAAEKARDLYLRKHYGITSATYEAMLAAQDGRCAVCRMTNEEAGGSAFRQPSRFAVDHDHSCGPGQTSCGACVRGLLCGRCNTAIGHFGDDPDLMASAIRYLSEHSRGSTASFGHLRPTVEEADRSSSAQPLDALRSVLTDAG